MSKTHNKQILSPAKSAGRDVNPLHLSYRIDDLWQTVTRQAGVTPMLTLRIADLTLCLPTMTVARARHAIEKEIKDLEPNERYAIRQQKSVPLLNLIKEWTDNSLHNTLPKGHLGTALNYLNKNWEKLTVYTQDGRLKIDNNPAKNAIRPFVIGRKNGLFSATVQGATSSANLYSLIETSKANQLEPYSYLRRVFKALPLASTVDDIEVLLPWNMTVQDGVG